jgi:hypothetical protein
MNEQRRVTTSVPNDWLSPGIPPPGAEHGYRSPKVSETLGREAAEREMALVRAMNPPSLRQAPAPELRAPTLPDDFAQRCAELDKKIVEHGVGIDRDRLILLGKERFQQLLEADREARIERGFGPHIDLSRWGSVQFAFANLGALEATAIRERTNSEILSGAGLDRGRVQSITSFEDLWKSTSMPRAVSAVYTFRGLFESLLFARSLLEQIGDDNRLHSVFFADGNPRKVLLFRDWIQTLRGPLVSVAVRQPLFTLMSWMAQEKEPAPGPGELAREFFDVRAPAKEQLRFTEALLEGFCQGLDSWDLWQFVGRLTHKAPDLGLLEDWRRVLAQRFPGIAEFHHDIACCFYRPVGSGGLELDHKRHRLFIDGLVHDHLQQISFVIALAVDDALPGSLVARFQSWFLCETAKPPQALHDKIDEALKIAFPDSTFTVEMAEEATSK